MYKSNNSSFRSSFGSYGSGSSNDSPVNVGTQYDVKIEDTAKQGDGIARISGLVVFVPNTKINDSVKVEIKEIKRNCAVAEVVVVPEEVTTLGQVE
ncbi:MAG: TRAM domain-containing protein [Halobacteriota archaeon]